MRGPGKIVSGAERQDGDGRRRRDFERVDDGEEPSGRSVAAAGEHAQVGHFAEELESGETSVSDNNHHSDEAPNTHARLGPSSLEVEHLAWVEQPVELVQQLQALVASALRVDEDDQRFGMS